MKNCLFCATGNVMISLWGKCQPLQISSVSKCMVHYIHVRALQTALHVICPFGKYNRFPRVFALLPNKSERTYVRLHVTIVRL